MPTPSSTISSFVPEFHHFLDSSFGSEFELAAGFTGTLGVVGIDPGKSGAITQISLDGSVRVWKMPDEERVIVSLLRSLTNHVFFLEDIPKWMGAKRHSEKNIYGADMATLCGNLQFMRGALASSEEIKYEIYPTQWQRHFKEISLRSSMPGWKSHLADIARTRVPGLNPIQQVSDSVLIAIFAKNMCTAC